jgi:4-aminobutyrate aminotransferase-like enzyme
LEENLQVNALKGGKRLVEGMTPFIEPYRIAGDARGSGLFLGVEQACGRETL